MKKHLSLLLVLSLVVGLLAPITVGYAEEVDPNIQLYSAVKESILGQALQNTEVDSLIIVDSIRTLQGTGFLSSIIDDLSSTMNSESNVAMKEFIRDNYGLNKASIDEFINILRNWSDTNNNDEDVFLSLFTNLKTGQDLDPGEDEDVLNYLDQLRQTVTTEMSDVVELWNDYILINENNKTQFLLDVMGAILDNAKVVKNSQGNLELTIKSESELGNDIEGIEADYLKESMPLLSEQEFDYIDTINDCLPSIEDALKDAIDNTNLTVDNMVDLLQALGVTYTETTNNNSGHTGGSNNEPEESTTIEPQESQEPEEPTITEPEDNEDVVEVTLGEGSVEVEESEEGTVAEVNEEAIDNALAAIEELEAQEEQETQEGQEVEEGQEKKQKQLEIVIEVPVSEDEENVTLDIPVASMKKISEKKADLVIKSGDVEFTIPADALDLSEDNEEGTRLSLNFNLVKEEEVKEVIEKAKVSNNTTEKKTLKVLDFSLSTVNKEGKKKSITKFKKNITLKADVKDIDPKEYDKLGVYYINEETGEATFVGGKIDKNGKIIFKTNHFSKYALLSVDISFDDVKNHWAKSYIESMAAKHVIDGYDDGTYRPSKNVTRGEFIKLVVLALDLDLAEYEGVFSDVSENDWFANYVQTAYNEGIVDGYDDGTFKPYTEISRLEMAALLSRGLDVEVEDAHKVLARFNDANSIMDWGKVDAAKAVEAGLIEGIAGQFVPEAFTPRSQAATAIYRLYNK